jgi:hypothetical protein
MITKQGIPILDGKVDQSSVKKGVTCGLLATNALQTMTEELVKMEGADAKATDMMEKCVWPILYEAAARFRAIAEGDFDIPEGGFEFVVG